MIRFLKFKRARRPKAKIDHHGKVGEMVTHAAEAKAANHTIKALITPLVEGRESPRH